MANLSLIPRNDDMGDQLEIVPPLVSDHTLFYFKIINWAVICTAVCVFGVISNILNIIVFVSTGFKDSINLSLFALAISDLGSCFSLIFSTIALNPWIDRLGVPVHWDEIQYILACWPHVAFTKITTLITAFITFERCLCVTFPLKVKTIITRKRVIAYLVTCYSALAILMIPIFYANQIGWKFYPYLNKTLIGLVFTENRHQIEGIIYPIQNTISLSMFVFIIICTVILVTKLKEKTEWRKKATATTSKIIDSNEGSSDNKENKVSKMVTMISTVFIVCFLPSAGLQLLMMIDKTMAIDGAYLNLNMVVSFFNFTLECVNSSLNIFIYYKVSSNYKAVFDRIFRSKDSNTKSDGMS